MSNTFAIPDPLPDTGAPLPSSGPIDFGPNVLVFDPTMPSSALQAQVDTLYQMQRADQFGSQRYAILLKPGTYSPLNIQVGFYTTVHGLGAIPDATTVQGSVYATAEWMSGNATDNFWRGVENLAIVPTNSNQTVMWATSQATWLRRIHLRGSIVLFDNTQYNPPGVNWSSGGFVADSIIDTQVTSGSQQQYLTRNTQLTKWQGQNWNMVFVGDLNPPTGTWPADKYTVIPNTPIIREKPYLTVDAKNNYSVVVPALRKASQGPGWTATSNTTPSTSIPLSKFYVAKPNVDTASSINLGLQRGLHLLLTPGVYTLSQPIVVRNANTIVLGLGLATLQPTGPTPAVIVADVAGVTIAGLLLDAGPALSPNLMQVGGPIDKNVDNSANPVVIFDVSCRVGGAVPAAKATSCLVINSKNTILDNVWLWRADHGFQSNSTGWTVNSCTNGLIVNSDNVTAYGLFVEHFEGFQTLWNGNGGAVYFYQSECPYDVPNQQAWTQSGEKGYPSYKVANSIKTHTGQGIGVYCAFDNAVQLNSAVETPTGAGIKMNHLITVWLTGAAGSSINHILNGTEPAATQSFTVSPSTN
jgi:hypothetical protein